MIRLQAVSTRPGNQFPAFPSVILPESVGPYGHARRMGKFDEFFGKWRVDAICDLDERAFESGFPCLRRRRGGAWRRDDEEKTRGESPPLGRSFFAIVNRNGLLHPCGADQLSHFPSVAVLKIEVDSDASLAGL